MAPVGSVVGLPPKQLLTNSGGFHILEKHWMEVVEGLNVVFFLSTSPMVMEQ